MSEFLSEAAREYELAFIKGSIFSFPFVTGRIDSYPLNIERYIFGARGYSDQTLKFEIDIKQGKLHPFSLTAEGWFSHMSKFFGKNDILIGDESFDDKALIQGYNTPQLYILLNKKARSLIYSFISSAYKEIFKINESKITYYIAIGHIKSYKDVKVILDNIIMLAKILCRKGKPVDLLKENYLTETEKEVKKKLLTSLYSLNGFLLPDDSVIKKALGNKSSEIRFLGARLLKKEGYEHLKKIYEHGNVYIKKLVINHLKTECEVCFLDYFLEKAENESSTAVKQELADYFRVTGDVKAEPFLRKELGTKRDYETMTDFHLYKLTVIQALKYCGTYESIEPLYNVKQLALKREADEAIAAIQDRIGAAGDKGWLSISSDTDDQGKLSLTDEQDGDN